jgi:hypothetical protein
MPASSVPVLLTLLDLMAIIGIVISLIAVPTLLVSKQSRIAGKTTLAVLGAIAAAAAIHSVASLLKL